MPKHLPSYALALSLALHAAVLAGANWRSSPAANAGALAAVAPQPQVGLVGDTLDVETVLLAAQQPSPPAIVAAAHAPEQPAAPLLADPSDDGDERQARQRRRARKRRRARQRRRARRRAKKAASASGSSAAAASAASAQPAGPRRYGAKGMPRGAQHLAAAFVHALPNAVAADRAWSRLAAGAQGEVEVVLRLDAEGKLKVEHVGAASKALRRIAKRTWLMLRAGVYQLSNDPGRYGRETLRISVTLSDRAPLHQPNAKSTDAFKMGSASPRGDQAGAAYFTLASGRHFEAIVHIIGSDPRPPIQ